MNLMDDLNLVLVASTHGPHHDRLREAVGRISDLECKLQIAIETTAPQMDTFLVLKCAGLQVENNALQFLARQLGDALGNIEICKCPHCTDKHNLAMDAYRKARKEGLL
jgi:hypothetical protein